LDFLALQTELNARLHGDLGNTAFLVQLKTWVNLARKYIVALNPDWDFLQTETTFALVANQIPYTLATDLVKINQDEIRLTTSRKVLELLDVRKSGDPETTSSEPTHFRLSGYQSIQIFPPPTAAVVTAETSVTYEYTKTFPTDMVNNTDPHGLPPHLEPALNDIGEVLGWLYLRQPQASQAAWNRALATLQSIAPETELFGKLALNLEPVERFAQQGR
jgi:hypothetical protein